MLGLLVAACATPPDPQRDDTHFRHPERFVGQDVTVCGYVTFRREDQNIWFSRPDLSSVWSRLPDVPAPLGLGLLIDEEVRLGGWPHRQSGCFRGRMVYTGCWVENRDGSVTMCFWTGFNHALLISRHAWRPGSVSQSPSSGTP